MNKEFIGDGIETKVNTSVALSGSVMGYGRAISIEIPENIKYPRNESFKSTLHFYYGEYISGIFFISALLFYTMFVPSGVINPLRCVFSMIDRCLKKTLDFCGAILGIILALPIFIIVPILIKLDSRGSMFYTQDRVGVNRRRRSRRIYRSEIGENNRIRERRRVDYLGRPFKVIKFRTMIENAEKHCGPVWATKNDTRVTRIGKFLRKMRLDEVPQLINVLKGEMSLVGPRPERPIFVQELSTKVPNYAVRLRVKPGITGLAQVNRGYDSSVDTVVEKVEHDIRYIRSWSIFSDLKILARTVLVVLTGRGAC